MDILSIVISLFAFLFAITIHEASHAWTASKFGDPTAAAMGRVSLNPLAHIDPFGTVLLPLILVAIGAPAFGWAKPVMVNPRNLRHPRRDNLWISVSGPAANLTAAAGSLALILLMKALNPGTSAFLRSFLIERQPFPRGFYPLEGLALILFYAVLVNTYLAPMFPGFTASAVAAAGSTWMPILWKTFIFALLGIPGAFIAETRRPGA